MSIVRAISSARKRDATPFTADRLAIQFRQPPSVIVQACAVLEARGVLHVSQQSSELTNPTYTLVPQAPQAESSNIVGEAASSVLRATVQTFRSNLNLDLQLADRAFTLDQVTTEDLSIFARVTGDLEGSVCFGISQPVARQLLGIVTRRQVGTIDQSGILILNKIADRILGVTRSDLGKRGHSIDVSSASTLYPAGMKITTLGMPQSVATMRSRIGPVMVHVVLGETSVVNGVAA